MVTKHRATLKNEESGFIAIMIAMILMTVLTLVLLGFVRLISREKRQALDRQLSTQAYYAAEAGISDAAKLLQTSPNTTINDCNGSNPLKAAYNNVLDAGARINYPCVLINPAPGSLQYDDIGQDNPEVIRMHAVDNGPITSVVMSWQDSGSSTTFPTNSGFLLSQTSVSGPNNLATSTGVLRVSMTPVPAGPLSGDALLNASKTFFLYPHAAAAPGAVTLLPFNQPDADGKFMDGGCHTGNTSPYFCNVRWFNLNNDTIYLKVSSLYRHSRMEVRALRAGAPIALVGEQVLIDSTGKANDVLRRIQVRRPVQADYSVPAGALITMQGTCKRFTVWPGGAAPDPVTGDPANATACDLP
jgi:hypothetical protein